MHAPLIRKTIVLALVTVAMGFARGQPPQQDAPAQDAPAVHESAGIQYMSGGIGTDEVERMRALAPRFNVRIRFQDQSTGASLSDVKVVLLNTKNERLLRLVTEGPLLYLKMRPGRYLINAAYQDIVLQRTITVSTTARNMTLAFRVNQLEETWVYCRDGNADCKRAKR